MTKETSVRPQVGEGRRELNLGTLLPILREAATRRGRDGACNLQQLLARELGLGQEFRLWALPLLVFRQPFPSWYLPASSHTFYPLHDGHASHELCKEATASILQDLNKI